MCGMSSVVLTMEDGSMGLQGGVKPTLSYLDYADHLKVGYSVWPLLGDIEGLVRETINRCVCK